MKFSEKEKEYRKTTSDEEFEEFGQPRIMIVGCGGAGNNTVNRLYNIGIEGAETVCINTDKQHLDNVRADKKILVGKTLTRGLGAGGYPETGKKAAELARGTLEEVLKDVDLVFVTAGLEEALEQELPGSCRSCKNRSNRCGHGFKPLQSRKSPHI